MLKAPIGGKKVWWVRLWAYRGTPFVNCIAVIGNIERHLRFITRCHAAGHTLLPPKGRSSIGDKFHGCPVYHDFSSALHDRTGGVPYINDGIGPQLLGFKNHPFGGD